MKLYHNEIIDVTKSFIKKIASKTYRFIDVDNIKNEVVHKNTLNLIDLTYTPYPVHLNLDYLNDAYIITSDYSYYQGTNKKIIYFPSYFFQILNNPCLKKYDIENPRPYFLQCLNINPWLHKTLTVIELSKANWYHDCLVSFHWSDPPDRDLENFSLINSTLSNLNEDEKLQLYSLNLPLKLNLENEEKATGWVHVSNASNAHRLSYVDCVTESSTGAKFVSEKIWKPFLSGQLFVVVGPSGLVQHLKDIGLDVFEDIIDYKQYDDIKDIRLKIKIICSLLEKIHKDINKIWLDTFDRRMKNLNFVLSNELSSKLSYELEQLFL